MSILQATDSYHHRAIGVTPCVLHSNDLIQALTDHGLGDLITDDPDILAARDEHRVLHGDQLANFEPYTWAVGTLTAAALRLGAAVKVDGCPVCQLVAFHQKHRRLQDISAFTQGMIHGLGQRAKDFRAVLAAEWLTVVKTPGKPH